MGQPTAVDRALLHADLQRDPIVIEFGDDEARLVADRVPEVDDVLLRRAQNAARRRLDAGSAQPVGDALRAVLREIRAAQEISNDAVERLRGIPSISELSRPSVSNGIGLGS